MSDLGGGGSNLAPVSNGRAQNGGSRAVSGSGPTPQYAGSGARTPTEIMKQRRIREEKRKAESEARQKERDEAESRQAQDENLSTGRFAPIGGGDEAFHESTPQRVPADRRSDRKSSSNVRASQPSAQIAAEVTPTVQPVGPTRPRGSTVSHEQPRPVQQQVPRAVSHGTQQPRTGQNSTRRTSTAAVNSKEQAEFSGQAPGSRPQASQESSGGTQPRNPNTSSFPHAFERWETLSSHWEGLTSYWIHRLELNSDEMNREPINQQLARQVTDLSAAGANLFHAVVELQRLRASSERKFQRWFFETRAEQERAQEMHAGMENTLRVERQARADAIADVARVETEKNTAYQKKNTAEQMVKEMRRELQISKEEARRAWEELGRREQEERDRTDSLRNGEPTLVGGVQVVPMMQGAPSRQESSNRPSTREGPYTQGPNVSQLSARMESPLEDDRGYTTYNPTRSETDTDPFTEGGRINTSQSSYREPTTASLPAPTSQPQQTSNGSITPSQTAGRGVSPLNQQPNSLQGQTAPTTATASGTYLNYGTGMSLGQPAPSSFYQHEGPTLHQDAQQPRTTELDERSYVPSIDTVSEEDYELNDDGQVRLDAQGRPIFRGGLGSEDSDEYDVKDQQERERMYGRSYGSAISGVEYGSGATSAIPSGRPGATYTTAAGQGAQVAPADYSGNEYGSGLGWEAVPRHHHPTRLSDVLEEDERSRTSPSRASQTSRGLR